MITGGNILDWRGGNAWCVCVFENPVEQLNNIHPKHALIVFSPLFAASRQTGLQLFN